MRSAHSEVSVGGFVSSKLNFKVGDRRSGEVKFVPGVELIGFLNSAPCLTNVCFLLRRFCDFSCIDGVNFEVVLALSLFGGDFSCPAGFALAGGLGGAECLGSLRSEVNVSKQTVHFVVLSS